MQKRIVVLSDLHSGHGAGLTSPEWQWKPNEKTEKRRMLGEIQARMWDWYQEQAERLKPVHTLVVNGDAIDGKGLKSGGIEQLTIDRSEQVIIAGDCIDIWDAEKVFLTRGTKYHTGSEERWEDQLAELVEAEYIGNHWWAEWEGVIFDFKHKTSRSVIPHGRWTGPARDKLWNALLHEKGIEPNANIIVRSHVHYHIYGGDSRRMFVTTPSLQGWSEYGELECSGDVDIGLIVFDVFDGGEYQWKAHLLEMEFMGPRIWKL